MHIQIGYNPGDEIAVPGRCAKPRIPRQAHSFVGRIDCPRNSVPIQTVGQRRAGRDRQAIHEQQPAANGSAVPAIRDQRVKSMLHRKQSRVGLKSPRGQRREMPGCPQGAQAARRAFRHAQRTVGR